MTDITVSLTDAEYKALQSVAISPEFWVEHAATERAASAMKDIVRQYTDRALNEGVSIPATKELIVLDAFERGWVLTKEYEQTLFEAELASQAEAPTP